MHKRSILVIEDNDDLRENIAEILSLAGYEVATAADGLLGLKAIHHNPPSLIICDIMMPNLDGFGVLKALKSHSSFRYIPLIFLSAKADATDFRKGMSIGAVDYISKPFDNAELIQAIETRLSFAPLDNVTNISWNPSELGNLFRSTFMSEKLNLEIRTVKRKDRIYDEESLGRNAYFVITGCIKICKTTDTGKEVITDLNIKDDIFGYQDIISGGVHESAAYALTDSSFLVIPSDIFKQYLKNPALITALLYFEIGKHKQVAQRMQWVGFGSLRKKVAEALIFVMHNFQSQDIHILREDLAAIACVAKESLSRTLSDFKDENLISINDNIISIINVEKLNRMID